MELIGRQFGHIRVTEVIGEGGMGAVYAGHDEKLDRKVALKVLHADQRLDEEARDRLLREARALSKVDHPNICRIHDYIETGDVDLLVLEYIDGRTLQAAIDNGLAHTEKLRIALAVAEVLVRAHRAGIVHRDLKPENVMLTKTGEVKVLDFGLARWLHRGRKSSDSHQAAPSLLRVDPTKDSGSADISLGETTAMPSARPSDIFPSGRREFLATAAGITLGTPLYMSPEQARGEALTPASDMFSFGLLLQVLFTGKEPHGDVMSAREVILRVARGETNPVEGAPKDIAALINQLKMFAPADRPTAVQMVERLRFQIDKPQRIARRSIAGGVAVMMLFGGWRYTVDLDRERAKAIEQKTVAQEEKAKAEDLINFMVDDLRKKLTVVGRLDVLEAPSEKVLQYVQRLRPDAMSIDEIARHAKVLNQLGEVKLGLGKTPEAIDFFKKSLLLSETAMKRDPRSTEALMVYGNSHFWIGNSHRLKGDLNEALTHMREYMKAGDTLVEIDPLKKENQLERAYGHAGVAVILESKGDLAGALRHYEQAREVKHELARRDPADLEAQAELARAYNKVAVLLYKKGDLRGALDYSQREVEIYRRLVSQEPKQAIWKRRLSNSVTYLARTLSHTGNSDAARAMFEEALTMNRAIAALDPANVEWQRNVAMSLRWLASEHSDRGDRSEALKLCREAVEIIVDVVKRDPSRTGFVIDSMNVKTDYARLLAEQGDPRGMAMLREVLTGLEAVAKDRMTRYQAGRCAVILGELSLKKDRAAAAAAFDRAARHMEPIVEQTTHPDEMAIWTRLLIHQKRLPEARASLARLRGTGYATTQLEQLCSEHGC